MSITLVKNVNFGYNKRNLSSVGYMLIDELGVECSPRLNNVYEVGTSTGIYGAQVTFPTEFNGSILWDTGEVVAKYASEEYSPSEERLKFNFDINGGHWLIDADTNQMIFYTADNSTEVARFDMKNQNNTPSVDEVFSRTRV